MLKLEKLSSLITAGSESTVRSKNEVESETVRHKQLSFRREVHSRPSMPIGQSVLRPAVFAKPTPSTALVFVADEPSDKARRDQSFARKTPNRFDPSGSSFFVLSNAIFPSTLSFPVLRPPSICTMDFPLIVDPLPAEYGFDVDRWSSEGWVVKILRMR